MRYIILSLFLIFSNAYAEDATPAELANRLKNSINNLNIPVEFIVTSPNGTITGEHIAIANSFHNSNESTYKGYTFKPLVNDLTVTDFTDTYIIFTIQYDRVAAFKPSGQKHFNLENNFYARVRCTTAIIGQDYVWACGYLHVVQDFGGNLWPHPIRRYSYDAFRSYMGPNKRTLQQSILNVVTAIHEDEY